MDCHTSNLSTYFDVQGMIKKIKFKILVKVFRCNLIIVVIPKWGGGSWALTVETCLLNDTRMVCAQREVVSNSRCRFVPGSTYNICAPTVGYFT